MIQGTERPPNAVEFGERFNGQVLVTGVRHEMDSSQGWRTHLQFGGSGDPGGRPPVQGDDSTAWQGQPASAVVDLPPLGVLWLARRRP